MPRFDVYGRFVVEVVRRDAEWVTFHLGADGKRRLLTDVPIPGDLDPALLERHLEDVFHEHGSPGLVVRRLD